MLHIYIKHLFFDACVEIVLFIWTTYTSVEQII